MRMQKKSFLDRKKSILYAETMIVAEVESKMFSSVRRRQPASACVPPLTFNL